MVSPAAQSYTDILPEAERILESRLPRAVELLRELVSIPSYRGVEVNLQNRIASEFAAHNLEVTKVFIDPEKLSSVRGFSPSKLDYRDRPNVVGVLRGTGEGPSLALNFHSDTAPPGPAELWSFDPYGGDLVDGKLYGRGAWDDKAGCALALLVLQVLRDLDLKLQGDLVFESVIEDEHTGNGTLAIVADGFTTDAAIVMDGAYGPHAIIGHPGYTNFRVTVYGKSAPSCRSELGENAIEKVFPIMQRLRALEAELNGSLPAPWKASDHPINFNIGTIEGGSWTGTVAAKCSFDAQMSFLPPYDLRSFRERLTEEISRAAQADDWLRENAPPSVEFFDLATDPVCVDSSNRFMTILNEGCEAVFKEKLNTRLVTGWCDLRHFSLFSQTPCCLFGPGRGGNAHRPDEYFEVEELKPHAKVLLHQVINWCGLA